MEKQEKLIMLVAKEISKIVPKFSAVTLGGSRMHGTNDEISDAELYFYSNVRHGEQFYPRLEDINKVMLSLNASHKRSDEFLWIQAPWGPHSFFVVDGLYFEIGYRSTDETKTKLENYIYRLAINPFEDCHDLGLGYMNSGFASSVLNEKILICNDNEVKKLKSIACCFPNELLLALKSEYLDTAELFYNGKLLSAVNRNDACFFNVVANRVLRALFIMAFAVGRDHFPGDKWNKTLLLRSNWKHSKTFVDIIDRYDSLRGNDLEKRYQCIGEALSLLKNCFKDVE